MRCRKGSPCPPPRQGQHVSTAGTLAPLDGEAARRLRPARHCFRSSPLHAALPCGGARRSKLAALAPAACRLPDADGAQRRFLRAVTCRGLFQSAPPAGAVQLVSAAELEALRARPGAVWYQNPLFPDETEAVWLPGEARYYRGPDTPLPELSDVFSLLAQAKALHDELEAVYNPHVDFARVYALAHAHALQLLG